LTKAARIEREIAARIRAAKIRLRSDKVVRRVSSSLQAALAGVVSKGQCVVLTVTAPIRCPADTAGVLENLFRDGTPRGEIRRTIHGNQVRVRTIAGVATYVPKVTVLVHNPDSDSDHILAIAEARLLQRK
jgi:hypothetical protein